MPSSNSLSPPTRRCSSRTRASSRPTSISPPPRRVYSRWKREIPLLGRKGELLIVEPSSGEIRRGAKKDYPKIAPFDSEKNYRAAIKEEGGEVPKEGLRAA